MDQPASKSRPGVCSAFALDAPEVQRDVFGTFAAMRAACPVAWSEDNIGYWLVTSYEGTAEVLRNPAKFTTRFGRQLAQMPEEPERPFEWDGPQHRELRRYMNPFFSTGQVAPHLPAMRRIADEIIEGFIESGRCDLANDYARPFPARVFMELFLGLGGEELEQILPHVDAIAYARFSPGNEAGAAYLALVEWARALLDRYEAASDRPTVIDAILRATTEDRPLTRNEQVGIMQTMVVGGAETSRNAIAAFVAHLLEDEPLRERLQADRSLLPSAVDELLRFYSPSMYVSRTALEDLELHGCTIREGDRVLVSLSSANRDEAEFEKAHQVVADRSVNRMTAFGLGPHRCLGSHLARAEVQVGVAAVLDHLPDFHLADGGEVRWAQLFPTRGPSHLPLVFTPKEVIA